MSTTSAEPLDRQRNPRGEGARLRLEILDATHGLLAGGEAVTLRSIARRVGVAAPSIYRHFADVDAVMSVVVEQAFDELLEALIRQRESGLTAADRLRAVSAGYLGFAKDRPHLYQLMFGGVWNAAVAIRAHPDDERRFRELGMAAHAVLKGMIRDCVSDGSSTSTDLHQDATAVWVALHGLAQLRRSAPLFPWPQEMMQVLVFELAHLRPTPALHTSGVQTAG